jgi:hypothetical protein
MFRAQSTYIFLPPLPPLEHGNPRHDALHPGAGVDGAHGEEGLCGAGVVCRLVPDAGGEGEERDAGAEEEEGAEER